MFKPSHFQPLSVRAKSMSLAVASNWLWNFGIGYATPYLVDKSTTGINGVKTANLGVKVFFIWGGTCVGCFVFAYVPLSLFFSICSG
jgi:SP family sugar:H+ symporter-like MFS transporter